MRQSEYATENVISYCVLLLYFLFQGSNYIEYNLDTKLPIKYMFFV